MDGEKSTNKALQLEWQGTQGPADGFQTTGHRKIIAIGIGNTGNNTITQLTKMNIANTHTIAICTCQQHFNTTQAHRKILITKKTKQTLETLRKQIEQNTTNPDIIFVTTNLDTTLETNIAPTIAEIAKKQNALTIGIISKPHRTSNRRRPQFAHTVAELRRKYHTVILIDNNKLKELTPHLPKTETTKITEQTLANLIKNIIETLSTPTHFKTIMKQGGITLISTGESDAPNRAEEAIHNALKNPLLDTDYANAAAALVHITGGPHMTKEETNHINEIITQTMNNNTQIIWDTKIDPTLKGKIKVTLLISGVNPPQKPNFTVFAPQLFNLEPHSKPERKLPVNLDLYQLENWDS